MNILMNVNRVDQMDPIEEREFWRAFEDQLADDDGAAAKAHLAAGRPIYFEHSLYPDKIVRKWPNGNLELVAVDLKGNITLIHKL